MFAPPHFAQFQKFHGLERLADAKIFILQGGIAAGIAFWFAHEIIGHPQPFFAPMSAVIALGGRQVGLIRRSVELVVGVSVGVGVGDLVISRVGTGTWQITAAVILALAAAVFLDHSPLAPIQASGSAVLVATIMPPGTSGGTSRMVDALVGGLIGIAVMSIIPANATRPARKEIATVIGHAGRVLDDVATGLATRDVFIITQALASARGTQAKINSMILAVETGSEIALVSPFYWKARRQLHNLSSILSPVDNAMRNSRVLARRAATMVSDHSTAQPQLVDLLRKLAEVCQQLHDLYQIQGKSGILREKEVIPDVVARLRTAAAMSDIDHVRPHDVSEIVVMAQARSIIVDLLQVCRIPRSQSVEILRPGRGDLPPADRPEIWEA